MVSHMYNTYLRVSSNPLPLKIRNIYLEAENFTFINTHFMICQKKVFPRVLNLIFVTGFLCNRYFIHCERGFKITIKRSNNNMKADSP